VVTELGVEVGWNGASTVEVHAPGQYMGRTCGICGNYNADPTDDRAVGPQCPADQGTVVRE